MFEGTRWRGRRQVELVDTVYEQELTSLEAGVVFGRTIIWCCGC